MRFGWNEGEGSKIREERKEEGGMTFRRSMIFKLSAPAYDARVKSFGVDFRGELEKKALETRGECGLTSNPLGEMNQTHPRDAGHTLG